MQVGREQEYLDSQCPIIPLRIQKIYNLSLNQLIQIQYENYLLPFTSKLSISILFSTFNQILFIYLRLNYIKQLFAFILFLQQINLIFLMSQSLQENQNNIIKKELLPSQWTLWFSYSCHTQNAAHYGNNLMQVQKVHSWNEFTLLWKWVSKTEKFFIKPEDGSYNKYKFGLEERKIDSINFFKDNIQPQWQYKDNPKYGYFNFGIERQNQKVNEFFEASVFLGVGEKQQISKEIFGVRIVDVSAKQTHPCRARIEIWVRFRHDNSKKSLEKLLQFQQKLNSYYLNTIGEKITQIRFFNISTLQGEETKTPKKQHNKKNQGNYKNTKKNDRNIF